MKYDITDDTLKSIKKLDLHKNPIFYVKSVPRAGRKWDTEIGKLWHLNGSESIEGGPWSPAALKRIQGGEQIFYYEWYGYTLPQYWSHPQLKPKNWLRRDLTQLVGEISHLEISSGWIELYDDINEVVADYPEMFL